MPALRLDGRDPPPLKWSALTPHGRSLRQVVRDLDRWVEQLLYEVMPAVEER